MSLSASQVREFEENGFLAIDPMIESSVIDAANADLREVYLPAGETPDRSEHLVAYRDDRRIQDGWRVSTAVKDIATAPHVLSILEQLYGRRALPFQTLNFRVGTEQKAHSDTIHFNSEPAGLMCGVWTALEDIGTDSGPLVYFPGSHKLPVATLEDVNAHASSIASLPEKAAERWRGIFHRRRPNAERDYPKYERYIDSVLASHPHLQPQYACLKKGQAFIWSANLLHGGSLQRNRSLTRLSQVTHYFFEGSRYYTPILSTREQPFWREPKWIAG